MRVEQVEENHHLFTCDLFLASQRESSFWIRKWKEKKRKEKRHPPAPRVHRNVSITQRHQYVGSRDLDINDFDRWAPHPAPNLEMFLNLRNFNDTIKHLNLAYGPTFVLLVVETGSYVTFALRNPKFKQVKISVILLYEVFLNFTSTKICFTVKLADW